MTTEKENFPWESIAVLGRVLEANSYKHPPANWRKISIIDHCEHADEHLDNIINYGLRDDFKEDHLAHAFTRLAMAVALREIEKETEVMPMT